MKKITILFLIGFLFLCTPHLTAQSITINATTYKQKISLMGGDMERSSGAIQSSKNTKEMVKWGFKDIAFNTCRIQFDKYQEYYEGTKDWSIYKRQILTMKDVKNVNPNIKFWATLHSDYDSYGNNNNMPDWIVNYSTKAVNSSKYAIFLADYLEYMNKQGVPIFFVSIAKEWTNFVTADIEKLILIKLKSECASRGITMPKIVGPATWSISRGNNFLDKVKTIGSDGYYTSFSTHNYNDQDNLWSTFDTKCETLGKRVWNDETSAAPGDATSGAEPNLSVQTSVYAERCNSYENGLEGEIFFEIWSRGINKETRAIYSTLGGTGIRMRSYYMMKKFANLAKWSSYITSSIHNMNGVSTMSFRLGNTVNLWIINDGSTKYTSKPIYINGATITGNMSKTYWTNTTSISGDIATPTWQSNIFWATTDPYSISCYTFDVADAKSSPISKNRRDKDINAEVYQNPSTGSFTLQVEGLINPSYTLYDIKGKKIISKSSLVASSIIPTDNLSKGIFILKINSENKNITQKVILE